MNSSPRNIALWVLILCGCFASAQETQPSKSLREVLNTLEKQYDFQFNYIESTIEGIKVDLPASSLSFEEAINDLQQKTGLIFNILENNFVSIKRKESLVLCGYLKDKDTQEPVALATVIGIQKSTISDDFGYFELEVNTTSEMIEIRHLGYRTISREFKFFNLQGCAPIFLVPQEQSLSQVVLSSYLVEGINKLNTGALEIEFEKFNILPGLIESDVLQAVQAFPGIQSINETVSNINIRGGTHDQNLILWDDIKMYQSGHFFGLISAFNPQITQKVSLLKNGTGVDYSDGVSGTIAMQTNESVNTKFKANIGVNLIDLNGFVDIPIGKKSSVQVAARKSLSDIVETPTYNEYFSRISQDTEIENNTESVINTDQQFDFYDTSLRWLYRISDKDQLRLNFININNELLFNENAIVLGQETSRESGVSQNSIAGGLHYQRNWNPNLQTVIQVYETDYKLKAVNANLFESQQFLQENKVSETGARAKSSYKFNDTYVWHLGYQFLETQVTNLDDVDFPLFRLLISEVVRTHSGFTQLDFRSANKKTNLNIGLRYNYLDKFQKSVLEPRLSFNQKFAGYFSLEVSGEFKHQITSQIINFQNDFLGVEKRRWQLSNDNDIPVVESKQASLGVNYSRKGWLLSAEGYYKNVNGITTQSQGFQNQYEFVKSNGSYDVMGVDLLIRKRFKNANIWISYSYMDNEYTFKNLPETVFPSNLDITQTVTFGATYRYKGLKLAAGYNWHTGKPTTRPVFGSELNSDEINYGATNSSRLKDYLRVDASVLYDFKIGKALASVGISVWNILDEENEINNYYRINEEGVIEELVQNSLGLTSNAFLRVSFN